MMALHSRLTKTMFVLACALCALGLIRARAQEVTTASEDGGKCATAGAPFVDALSAPHWNGWGVDSSQHRFQPSMMAQLAPDDVPRLKVKWAFGYPVRSAHSHSRRSWPVGYSSVARTEKSIRSIRIADVHTGNLTLAGPCARPLSSANKRAAGQHISATSAPMSTQLTRWTGRELWKTRIDDHAAARITGSPTLTGATLFVPVSPIEEVTGANPTYSCCIFRGSVVELEASTGKLQWKGYTIVQEAKPTATNAAGVEMMGPSGAAIWSSPTFDGVTRRVYVTTGDNYSDPPTDTLDAILAFGAESGELVWSRQTTTGDAYNFACGRTERANCPQANGPDYDFGSSAVLTDLPGGKRALIGAQKSGVVTAVDPDHSGEIIWQKKVERGGKLGGVQWGVATDESTVYVAVSDLELNAVAPGSPGAQTSPFNPKVALLLDNKVGGGLHALNIETGEEPRQTPHPGCNDVPGCSPAQSVAVTAIPGIVFSGGIEGHLRAYSANDGRIVWDVDTKTEYATVNGVAARGGSIDGPGAVVVGGTLYISSGSGFLRTLPGNVLLAYLVDGR
jgi:polyvinyl alcohol dehydrogenase (cytochrome)